MYSDYLDIYIKVIRQYYMSYDNKYCNVNKSCHTELEFKLQIVPVCLILLNANRKNKNITGVQKNTFDLE